MNDRNECEVCKAPAHQELRIETKLLHDSDDLEKGTVWHRLQWIYLCKDCGDSVFQKVIDFTNCKT